ncbi:uncharacterized protein LOC144624760 [Crassostrea virginica]
MRKEFQNVHTIVIDEVSMSFPKRKDVDSYNNEQLEKLQGIKTIPAVHFFSNNDVNPMSSVNETYIPLDDQIAGGLRNVLRLSIGARVMLIRNIFTEKGLVNGALGVITGFQYTDSILRRILVKFDDPKVGKISSCNTINTVHEPIPIEQLEHEFIHLGRPIVVSEYESIQLHVLKVSEKIASYMNKSNKEMKYFNCVGAIGDYVIRLRIYLTSKFTMIKPGTSFKFVNVSKRGEKEYWVTSQSKVLYTSVVETNITADSVLLPEEIPPEGEVKLIKDALKSPEKSIIAGKIVKVSPLKYRQNGALAVKALLLKDQEKTAKVCLFGRNAETPYSKGETVKITAVYPKKYMDTLQLTTSPASTCEFIHDEPSIHINDDDGEDFNTDVDFMEDQDDTPIPIILTDFADIDIYQCCSNEGRLKYM